MDFKVKDIAAMLNLSPATVSLVINNKPGISDATRKRVYGALEELGLQDALSEILAEKKSIQLFIFRKKSKADSDGQYFSQIFSGTLEGIDVKAKELGFNLMIAYMDEENITGHVADLEQNKISGILLLGTDMEPRYAAKLIQTNIPVVVIDNYYETQNINCVTINNEQGVFYAVSHLADMGHKEIGYIHSTVGVQNFSERYHGFLRAMEKYSFAISPGNIICLDSDTRHMQANLKSRFEQLQRFPTAFLADNDIVAIHAINAFKEINMNVPENISIIGFDDMPLSEMMAPPLSTVHVDKKQLGSMAVKRLFEIIQDSASQPCKIEVGTRLIVRSSVNPVRR